MYAVLDIESSGGKRGQEKIIEIAIFRFDGREVVDQLISLVNTDGAIHPYVQKLTGITPNMLRRAPKFHELAKRIIQITDGAVLVGHNVAFDYRMLEQEFASLGYEYRRETLDTIKLTQKLIPGLKSYGLENISRELNIYNPQRHRAAGDARVTLELFKILLEKDQQKDILSSAKPLNLDITRHHDAGKLARLLDLVQPEAGVFYLRDANGKILKTGFAKNLFSELNNIFLLDFALKDQVVDIQTELTGNDLISKLKLYTQSLANPVELQVDALYMSSWQVVWKNGKFILKDSDNLLPESVVAFEKRHKANVLLRKLMKFPKPGTHKAAVHLVKKIMYPGENFLLKLPGRSLDETAVIAIENYTALGYGYYRLHYELQRFEAFRKTLTPLPDDAFVIGQLITWMHKYPKSVAPLPGSDQTLAAGETQSLEQLTTED
ncbi:exonuclease [Thermaurantimonas aggregans]|uniref:Exonuclease n=1 Tax=Thermaurantimonas aggregans TaxID=2173829 RepID=A0A401XLD9_9FLAO|nr:exonuclease domain-containing protein [Thermaurantimonas aggregans]GCD77822.1 exonuclease [Thermaurantimonas aggregans]